MRLTDAVLSVPRLLLLMVAAAVLQPSVPMLVLLVGAGRLDGDRARHARGVAAIARAASS